MAKVLKTAALMALITGLMATAAYAAVLYGTSADDTINGTDQIDSIACSFQGCELTLTRLS